MNTTLLTPLLLPPPQCLSEGATRQRCDLSAASAPANTQLPTEHGVLQHAVPRGQRTLPALLDSLRLQPTDHHGAAADLPVRAAALGELLAEGAERVRPPR